MNRIGSAPAEPPSQSLSLLIQSTGLLESECVDHVPAMPLDWKWYLERALMNLAGWLLLFGMLFLLSYYMQSPTSPFVEQ
jgi:hypothetical protein